MTGKLKQKIYNLLKKDDRLWNEEKTELNQTLLLDLVDKIDEKIIGLLLQEQDMIEKFFVKIKDVFVFKTNDFKFFINENKTDNSYTQYKNEIGLSIGNRFLNDSDDVVLNFPFKDCVLEGGQSKKEGLDTYFEYEEEKAKTIKGKKYIEPAGYKEKKAKRIETFFNEILAKDEIDRLRDRKALVNWKRYTKDGEEEVKNIKRNENGTIKENLVIKGNNLLALHSLKKQFARKVKLIYIDPPYNIGNDDFKYNDRYNHSTWLTFMKNRLEVAKDLLKDDGAIFVQIDNHELAYLMVLMDEIFKEENFVQLINVKTASPAGFKTVNPGPIDVTEYILFYTKNRSSFKFKKGYVPTTYDSNYNLVITNPKENPENWKMQSLRDIIYLENGISLGENYFQANKNAKELWGKHWKIIREQFMSEYALENAGKVVSIRDPHKPTKGLKTLLDESKKDKDKIFIYEKQSGNEQDQGYVINGGALSFYSNKIKDIDGKRTPTMLLSDLWTDISWDGIAQEGHVKLKNGKKPERLIKRIIEIATDGKDDIVLDFFLGSGTTIAVAHKMERNYIGIEQLYYGENDSVIRLQNVINGDQTGISKSVNWQGGGNFIYCELAKFNEQAKEVIISCKSLEGLINSFDIFYENYFLNYNLKIKLFKEKVVKEENFNNLSLEEQKKIFLAMLDLNQMYVQKTEMADKRFGISKEDQKLSSLFYGN